MTQAITANGAGYIDLRTATGGTSGHIVLDTDGGATDVGGTAGAGIDAGKLVSTTGTINVIAGGALSTTSATGGAAEIDTGGHVLLEAKNTIGTDANRIELANAAKLAARTLGGVATDSLFVRKLGVASALEVGTVNRVNATAVDNAITSLGTNSASLAGLTTSSNGNITLTTQGGSLTVTQAIAANGSGYVDLRTAGTTSDININGATVQSGSGTLQLVAGRSILTSTATGTTAELQTTGNVLLKSGDAVGVTANRIDLNTVSKVAVSAGGVATTGDIFVNQITGNLEVGSVSAVNAASTVDNTVATLNGASGTNNNDITVTTQAGSMTVSQAIVANGSGKIDLRAAGALSDLTLGAAITTTTGTLRLESGRSINQTAGSLAAAGAYVNAGLNASLLQAGNSVKVLAVNTGGGLDYLDVGDLKIDTVTVVDGAKNGVTSGTRAWVRSQRDLTLLKQVIGNGSGSEAVVLVADGAFRNQAGSTGVLAPNSRWLIYDINPTLEYRLGGLPFNYRRIESTYASYPPVSVAYVGNIYITDPTAVPTEQFSPPPVGTGTPIVIDPTAPGLGTPPTPLVQMGPGVGGNGSGGRVDIASNANSTFPVQGPLMVVTSPGGYFDAALKDFTGGEIIESAVLATGAPLPEWLKLDTVNQHLTGVMPKEGTAVAVKLRLKRNDGKPGREVEVLLTPST